MDIRSSRIHSHTPTQKIDLPKSAQPPEQDKSWLKDAVVKGAYASGGALAGVGLGVATGGVIGNLTGSSLSTVGGVLGALGGAASAVSVSDSENVSESLTKVALAWGGASLGAGLGQVVALHTIGGLAAHAGMPILASAAPFVGTATGAIVGAALPLAEGTDKLAQGAKHGAMISALGTIGLTAGLAGRAFLAGTPELASMGYIAPFLGAASGATLGNAAILGDESKGAVNALKMSWGTSTGYTVGTALGAVATVAGGSALYQSAFPVVGGVAGALWGYSGLTGESQLPGQKLAEKSAAVMGTSSLGVLGGDLVGNVLSLVSGQDIYRQVGPLVGGLHGASVGLESVGLDTRNAAEVALMTSGGLSVGVLAGEMLSAATGHQLLAGLGPVVGAANGAAVGLEMKGVDTKKVQPVLGATTLGLTAGALGGALVTGVTGHSLYNQLGAAAGSISGGLLGLEHHTGLDTKGAAQGVAGTVGGTAVGALLGASLKALTGQGVWTYVLPALGAAAGGLSALALKISR